MATRDPLVKAMVHGLMEGFDLSGLREPKKAAQPVSAQVLEYLRDHGDSTIKDISKGTGLRYFKVLSCLGYLGKKGRVQKIAKALYHLNAP